jgi:Tol biopolymer transport system component
VSTHDEGGWAMVAFTIPSPARKPARRAATGLGRATIRMIVLGCLVAAVAAPPVHAAYSGANGRIAYQVEADDGGPTHLWWANPDLSGAQQLTFGDHDEFDTAWSPDGTTLVYSTDQNATEPPPLPGFRIDIATLNVVTGEHHVFDTGAVVAEQPSFSPDGRRILFAGCFAACDPSIDIAPGLFTIRASDGGDLQRLPGEGPKGLDYLQWPRFSPDGSQIAFTGVKEPSWRQQGAAPREGAVFITNVDGSGYRRLTPFGDLTTFEVDWSPDGSQLVMQSDWRPGTRPSLWIVNADGSDLHRLTDELPIDAKQSKYFQASFAPTWSPDGSLIMFNCAPGELSFWDFCTIRPDGTGRTLVRSTPEFEHRPAWQPVP